MNLRITAKTILVIIVIGMMGHYSWAKNYKSKKHGSWTDITGVWDVSGFPEDAGHAATIDNKDSVRLQSGTYVIGDLSIKNNSTLVIDDGAMLTVNSISASNRANIFIMGTLDVVNDVSVGNNDTLNITSSGSVAIGGNFDGGNNVLLDVDGGMDVTGNFSLGSGSVITGTPGAITVGGTITNDGSDLDGVLPVVLHYFKASVAGAGVLLEWETLSELNNDFFTVERSDNGLEFYEIVRMPGQGTSEERVYYSFTDNSPISGLSYYRLKQTDFDGTTESFRMISVRYMGSDEPALKLYPNPVVSGDIRFSANSLDPQDRAILQILDLNGRSLIAREYPTASDLYDDGIPSEILPKGCYIVQIAQGGKSWKNMLIRQ